MHSGGPVAPAKTKAMVP